MAPELDSSAKSRTKIHAVAIRKLDVLNAAVQLEELTRPPGNRLEALAGDLAGFHSIRINQQWRLIFRWLSGDAHDVAIVDYH
jgi:proteic killer suppression protein